MPPSDEDDAASTCPSDPPHHRGPIVRHFYSATQQSVEDAIAAESGALEEAALAIQSRAGP